MNNNLVETICTHFELGAPIYPPQRVYGGLLHIMWHVNTDKASYAIKQLSKDIVLTDERIIKNYELSERIASRFIHHGIPAISALEKHGKHLIIIDGSGFLVYPWVDAKALDADAVSERHAIKIATTLAEIHSINLDEPDIAEPEFYTYTKEKILTLIDKSVDFNCPFASDLLKNQGALLLANEAYKNAIPVLKTHTVISHGDLDQKNVLWDSDNHQILIDWESACKVNPTYDIINTAFYWSGITTDFNKALFFKMIDAYQKAGGIINTKDMTAALNGAFSWIGWLVYNIERSCSHGESEQKTVGIQQANQTMNTIMRLQMIIPELKADLETSWIL